jgi:hypothetical protein
MARIADLDPATYTEHATHTGERIWAETNCYTDVVIELLHGLGMEPFAAMAFTLSAQWDVDQWTFFKFPPADIEQLYARTFIELAPWRPLHIHIHDQVAAGRPVLVELDSFFLPDTHGTAYQLAHVKSTVAVNEIDVEERVLGYFHNQSYHQLQHDDFDAVFQTGGLVHPRMLPPYIEFVRELPGRTPLEGVDRTEASLAQLRRELSRLPAANPFHAFRDKLLIDLEWLRGEDLEMFHTYSFATMRQYGACFELASRYLTWLEGEGVDGLTTAASALRDVSMAAKTMQFQLARAMMRRRALKLDSLDQQAAQWETAMDSLRARFSA